MKKLYFKTLFAIILFFPFITIAQTTHIVEVGPGLIYSQVLTISSGDVVSWVSLDVNEILFQGSHLVYCLQIHEIKL